MHERMMFDTSLLACTSLCLFTQHHVEKSVVLINGAGSLFRRVLSEDVFLSFVLNNSILHQFRLAYTRLCCFAPADARLHVATLV